MTQQEKYSLHLAYGLKVSAGLVTFTLGFDYRLSEIIKDISLKPYLRSLSDLTKPITQKDYNDGKPFVPYNHISRIGGSYASYSIMMNNLLNSNYKELPFHVVQQLLKWHFCIGFEQGEYIEVTEDNNPY